jgi:hypothetical protein
MIEWLLAGPEAQFKRLLRVPLTPPGTGRTIKACVEAVTVGARWCFSFPTNDLPLDAMVHAIERERRMRSDDLASLRAGTS